MKLFHFTVDKMSFARVFSVDSIDFPLIMTELNEID